MIYKLCFYQNLPRSTFLWTKGAVTIKLSYTEHVKNVPHELFFNDFNYVLCRLVNISSEPESQGSH